ncbi:MAG: hypothetical protein Q7U32_02670, partial [Rhodocyclaceae bacterium]|nr:hypothetical protein [Rhodocyclaceae bacterium]
MSAPQPDQEASALESIGHLKEKVCLMWGTQELDIFIGRLLMDSRDGTRLVFKILTSKAVLFLIAVALTVKLLRPYFK